MRFSAQCNAISLHCHFLHRAFTVFFFTKLFNALFCTVQCNFSPLSFSPPSFHCVFPYQTFQCAFLHSAMQFLSTVIFSTELSLCFSLPNFSMRFSAQCNAISLHCHFLHRAFTVFFLTKLFNAFFSTVQCNFSPLSFSPPSFHCVFPYQTF